MACRAAPGLGCSWSSVAARPLPLESAVGSVVGCACGAFAIRPSPRAAAWSDRSSSFRRASLERLAASDIRPNSLCCCCRVGWVAAPALHHAKNRESADLGFHPCPDRARVCHPLLGRAARAAAAFDYPLAVASIPRKFWACDVPAINQGNVAANAANAAPGALSDERPEFVIFEEVAEEIAIRSGVVVCDAHH